MLHRILCWLYLHAWGEWVAQYNYNNDHPAYYGAHQYVTRHERHCKLCGAMERHRYNEPNYR